MRPKNLLFCLINSSMLNNKYRCLWFKVPLKVDRKLWITCSNNKPFVKTSMRSNELQFNNSHVGSLNNYPYIIIILFWKWQKKEMKCISFVCSSVSVKNEAVCFEKRLNTSVSVQGHLPFTNDPDRIRLNNLCK